MTFRRYIFRSRVFALNVVAAVVLPLTELTVHVEWGVKLYSLSHSLTRLQCVQRPLAGFFWGKERGWEGNGEDPHQVWKRINADGSVHTVVVETIFLNDCNIQRVTLKLYNLQLFKMLKFLNSIIFVISSSLG